jgi:signal transduction histidine kinase
MAGVRAGTGAFVWSKRHKKGAVAITIHDGQASVTNFDDSAISAPAPSPFLYDLAKGRGLRRDPMRNLRSIDPGAHIATDTAIALELGEGIAIPIFSEGAEGQIHLQQVPGLSTDHLELGAEIAAAVEAHLQRQALMKAAADSAEARSRLAIARDLHDSVVQFLAGAAFRLEAMKRSEDSGRELTPDLNELKQLMLQEQSELRSFITALRSGTQMELAELARDLQSLSQRLSRQWDVQCSFSAEPGAATVPARLHLDAQQLVREAVANAVRHAGAKNVSIRLAGGSEEVRLDVINDGSAYPRSADGGRMPRSLRERVESAGGALELSRGMGVTKISISLPAGKAA